MYLQASYTELIEQVSLHKVGTASCILSSNSEIATWLTREKLSGRGNSICEVRGVEPANGRLDRGI